MTVLFKCCLLSFVVEMIEAVSRFGLGICWEQQEVQIAYWNFFAQAQVSNFWPIRIRRIHRAGRLDSIGSAGVDFPICGPK